MNLDGLVVTTPSKQKLNMIKTDAIVIVGAGPVGLFSIHIN